jgi:hypothetical protein
MSKFFFLFIALLNINFINAQAPAWQWAKNAGGMLDDQANSVAVDGSGNSYVAGYFDSQTITFGSTTLTNANTDSTGDIFLAKYNASGSVIWAKNAGGTGDDGASSVAADGSGNIYVTGSFTSPTITFGSITLTNAGSSTNDLFLAKYDASGNIIWAKSAGGAGDDGASSVAMDNSGNIYVAGGFTSPTITFGSTTLTIVGTGDIFLVKYDANGNVLWAKNAGGIINNSNYNNAATSVAIDASGNSYVAGYFSSPTITFGSTTLTNTNTDTLDYNSDIFLAKYDANGNVIWAKKAGGSGDEDDDANSVAVDGSGNAYVVGFFDSNTITFDTTTLTNTGNFDIFLVKYDANGNVIWAKGADSSGDDGLTFSVAVDGSGNSYVAGMFDSPSFTLGSNTLINAGDSNYTFNMFLAKYDVNGNVLWAKSASETSEGISDRVDEASSISVDASGNSYVAGSFESLTITFGSYTLTNADTTCRYVDIFVAKLGSNTGINEFTNSLNIVVYPNPATNSLTIESPQNGVIEITNIQGQLIKSFMATSNKTSIDVSAFPSGVYIIEVKTEKGIEVCKFVKE